MKLFLILIDINKITKMKKYIGTKEVLRQLILSQGDLRDIEEDIENTSVGIAE